MRSPKSRPPKGLTATIVFEAQSLNYDEGYGNLSVLKKIHRGSGEVFTFSSRQSLRHSIFVQGVKEFGWEQSKVIEAGDRTKKVIQLMDDITESEETDLFGYMRTNVNVDSGIASVMRTAPVRLSPAISMESYSSDIEMLTNKAQADKKKFQPNIANMENHRSLYRYSVSIDLHRIGTEEDIIGTRVSPNDAKLSANPAFKKFEKDLRKKKLSEQEKSSRVQQLLRVLGQLYRDIRGRREDLKPVFIIGGVYDTCNPFFENIVSVNWENDKPSIVASGIEQMVEQKYFMIDKEGKLASKAIKDETCIGIREGVFSNLLLKFGIDSSRVGPPEKAIELLTQWVKKYYESAKS